MHKIKAIRFIISGLIFIMTLVFVGQSNLAMEEGQTCFSSTAIHQFCIFYQYSGFNSPRAITISADYSMLAATSPETNTSIFSAEEGAIITEVPESSAYSLAFSPDSRTLAIGSDDQIALWDSRTRVVTKTLTDFEGGIFSLAFSPNGQYLVSGGEGKIHLWSMPDGRLLSSAEDNNLQFVDAIGDLFFSPSGEFLISMSIEGGKVWSISENSRLLYRQSLNSLADTGDFSPTGDTLAISGAGMNIELYDTRSYNIKKVIPFRSRPESNLGTSSLQFSFAGDRLIVGELGVEDYTAGVQIIDVESSEVITKIEGSGSDVYALESAFGGQYVVGLTSGETDSIIYWRLQ